MAKAVFDAVGGLIHSGGALESHPPCVVSSRRQLSNFYA